MRGVLVLLGSVGCAAALDAPALDEPAEPLAREVSVVPAAVEVAASPPRETLVEAHACIVDVVADARLRGPADDVFSAAPAHADELAVEPLPDLDDDGAPEQLVTHPIECGATGNCPWLLYLSSSGCPIFAGAFWSAYHDRLPSKRAGVHGLQTWTKSGCAGLAGSFVELAWNGSRFESVAVVSCDCNVDDPARDPLCPSVE